MIFTNSAKRLTTKRDSNEYFQAYSYDRPSPYLFLWSGLFQRIVSQVGTYLLTGKFHDEHCALYKSEGGCVIKGVGGLVLNYSGVYFEGSREKKGLETLAKAHRRARARVEPHEAHGVDARDCRQVRQDPEA